MNFRKFLNILLNLDYNIQYKDCFANIFFCKVAEIKSNNYSKDSSQYKFITEKDKYLKILLSHKNIDYNKKMNNKSFLYNLIVFYCYNFQKNVLDLSNYNINLTKETINELYDCLNRLGDNKIILENKIDLVDLLYSNTKSIENKKLMIDYCMNENKSFSYIQTLLDDILLPEFFSRIHSHNFEIYFYEILENLSSDKIHKYIINICDTLKSIVSFNFISLKKFNILFEDKIKIVIFIINNFKYNLDKFLLNLFHKDDLKVIINMKLSELNIFDENLTLLSIISSKTNVDEHFMRRYIVDMCYDYKSNKRELLMLGNQNKIFLKKFRFGISKNIKRLILFSHKDPQSSFYKVPLDIIKYLFEFLYVDFN